MPPGLHMKVQTVSEMLRMTLAFAAAASLLRAVVEWRQLHAAGKSPSARCMMSHRVQATCMSNKLAFAAAASLLRAVMEWRQLHAAGKLLLRFAC